MKLVEIKNKEIDYYVYISFDAINNIHSYIDYNKPVLIVTDDFVMNLHLSTLLMELNSEDVFVYSIGKNPEKAKNIKSYQKLVTYAINNNLNRDLQVIAFGGGAVGDFAGFFAATYNRGIKYIQMPTTILAHDSAVGGKVALNYNNIKNVIGSFYQPEAVIYHTEFLKTLSKEEILSGFGEVIKHDYLSDLYLSNNVLNKFSDLINVVNNEEIIEEILAKSITVKKDYILNDIYDKNKRKFLNLGHTLGHAIEVLYGFTHGEAVAFGMCFDMFLANNKDYLKLYKVFKQYGFFKKEINYESTKILTLIKHDKKNYNNKIIFIGLKKYGVPYEISIDEKDFSKIFNKFLKKIN